MIKIKMNLLQHRYARLKMFQYTLHSFRLKKYPFFTYSETFCKDIDDSNLTIDDIF